MKQKNQLLSLGIIFVFIFSSINCLEMPAVKFHKLNQSAAPPQIASINLPRGNVSSSAIELNWSASIGATSYKIYMVVGEGIAMTSNLDAEHLIGETTKTYFWATNLEPNYYTFAIVAHNDDGESTHRQISGRVKVDYYKQLLIYSPYELLTEDDYKTSRAIVYGNGSAEDPYIIANFTIINTGSSNDAFHILPINDYHLIIENLVCLPTEYGSFADFIELNTAGIEDISYINLTIRNNSIFQQCQNALWIMASDCDILIENNTFYFTSCELRNNLGVVNNAIIRNNKLIGNGYGAFNIQLAVSGYCYNNILNDVAFTPGSGAGAGNFYFYDEITDTGNYWNDYVEKYPEATNDGRIWDTPYEVQVAPNPVYNDIYPLFYENASTPIITILDSDSSLGDIHLELNVTSPHNFNIFNLYRETTEITEIALLTPIATYFPKAGNTTYLYNDSLFENGIVYYAGQIITHQISNVSENVLFNVELLPVINITIANSSIYSVNINLTWISSYADNYTVYRSDEAFDDIESATMLDSEIETLFYVDAVDKAGIYFYRILANNTYGSKLSNLIELEIILLISFTLFTVTLNEGGAINLTWATNNGVNFTIYKDTSNITDIGSADLLVENLSVNTYLDTDVELNIRYYYVIKANNSFGAPEVLSACKSILSRDIPIVLSFVVTSNVNGTVILSWEVFMGVSYELWSSTVANLSGFTRKLITVNTNGAIIFSQNGTIFIGLRAINEIGNIMEFINTTITVTTIIATEEPEPEPEPEPEGGVDVVLIIVIVCSAIGVGVGGYFGYTYFVKNRIKKPSFKIINRNSLD